MLTDDINVDELLMMWKTVGEVNSYVEICGKGIVWALFLPDFSTLCWNDVEKIVLLFFHLINSQCGKVVQSSKNLIMELISMEKSGSFLMFFLILFKE
jgi:hypothetical protein